MQVLRAQGKNEFEVFCEGDWSGFTRWRSGYLDDLSPCWNGICITHLCVAIIIGGVATLAFQDEIIEWLADKGYKCEKCGKSSFVMSKN